MFGWTIFWEVLGPIVREQWIHQSKRVLGTDCIPQTLSTGADDSGCSGLLYSRLGLTDLSKVVSIILTMTIVNGGGMLGHWGVDGQRKCPAKWPAKMSLVLLAMITDGSYSTRSRFMGGLRASMYFFAVSRWMPSSRATPRVDNPLRFAF